MGTESTRGKATRGRWGQRYNEESCWSILGREVTWAELFFKKITLAAMLRTWYLRRRLKTEASQVALLVKNLPAKADRHKRSRFDPWVRKIPWGGNGNPLQYFGLENLMDRGAWQAAVTWNHMSHGVTCDLPHGVGHDWSDFSIHT